MPSIVKNGSTDTKSKLHAYGVKFQQEQQAGKSAAGIKNNRGSDTKSRLREYGLKFRAEQDQKQAELDRKQAQYSLNQMAAPAVSHYATPQATKNYRDTVGAATGISAADKSQLIARKPSTFQKSRATVLTDTATGGDHARADAYQDDIDRRKAVHAEDAVGRASQAGAYDGSFFHFDIRPTPTSDAMERAMEHKTHDRKPLNITWTKDPGEDAVERTERSGEYDRSAAAMSGVGYKLASIIPMAVESWETIGKQNELDMKNPLQNELAAARYELEMAAEQDGRKSERYAQAKANLEDLEKQWDAREQLSLDPNSTGMKLQRKAQEAYAESLEGTEGLERFLRSTQNSILENLAALPTALISPAIPMAVLGGNAAASRTYELTNQGVNAGEAIMRGLVSGGIEAATESISLGSLLELVKSGGKSFVRELLKQGGIEAGEELTSYVANYIADVAAQDPNAKFDPKDMMQQAAGGFVSGLAFGTGGNVMGSAYTSGGDYQGTEQAQDIPALRQAAADMQSGSADLLKTGVTVQDGVTGRPMLPAAGMADTQQGSNAAALDIPSAAAAGSEQRSNLASFGRAVQSGSALGENGKKAASVLYDGTSDPASYYFDFARAYRAGLKGDESYSPSVLSEVEARAAMSSGRKDAAAAQQTRRAQAVNAPSFGNASGPIQNGSGVSPGTGTARPFDLTGRMTGNTASPAGAANLPGLRGMAPALTAGGPGGIVEADGRFLHTGELPSPSDHASGNSVSGDGITSDSATGGGIVGSGMAGNSPGGDSTALPDRAAAGDKPASAEDRPANEGAGNVGKIADGGNITRFTYKHNPSENPKVLVDAVEDPKAIYGYRPNKEGSLKRFADDDWSNPDYVEGARQKRIAYHQRNEVGILKLISSMRSQNYSDEQIVRAIVEFRNRNRLSSYLDAKGNIIDQAGYAQALAHSKTYEQLAAEGKTNEDIIKSAIRGNPGMDASTGLYDDYYDQYSGEK